MKKNIMKKLLLIMLASLFKLMSCDLDDSDDESTTTSNEDYAGTWVYTDWDESETYVLTDSTFVKTKV